MASACCIHASPTERPSTVECGLGLFGGLPHLGICARCDQREEPFEEDKGQEKDFCSIHRAAQLPAAMSWRNLSASRGGGTGLALAPPYSRLLLRNFQSPGDVLLMTAAVRDLHRAHPRQYLTAVQTSCGGLWENNPFITSMEELNGSHRIIECNYPLIHQSNQRPFHFIHGFVQDLEDQLGTSIPITDFHGDIHLSAEERKMPSPAAEEGVRGRYWIVMAGGKYDFTAKWWSPDFYQAVTDNFRGRIQFVQCGEAGHWHPRLRGVVNMIGKTDDVRRFIRLIYHADGVLCPVTFAMHLAAAVELRPGQVSRGGVVVAGGREPTQWEMYPGHQFLHTQGALDCCASGGCWKSRCQKVNDGDRKDEDLCTKPVQINPELQIPKCMHLITPERVIKAIELYYDGGALQYA